MGMLGTMIMLFICVYAIFLLFLKILGATHKENSYKSTEQAIQRDTDEFNHF